LYDEQNLINNTTLNMMKYHYTLNTIVDYVGTDTGTEGRTKAKLNTIVDYVGTDTGTEGSTKIKLDIIMLGTKAKLNIIVDYVGTEGKIKYNSRLRRNR